MSKLSKTFNKNVVTHLGDRSQRWLSKESEINSASINQIVSGDGNPTLNTVEAIAKALDVKPEVLLGGTDGKTWNIPTDILEALEGQTPEVYSTIRMILKTVRLARVDASHLEKKQN